MRALNEEGAYGSSGSQSTTSKRACGDVTGRRMLAHAATREGVVAVNNMFGMKKVIMKTIITERNAPIAGSFSRTPGDSTPIILDQDDLVTRIGGYRNSAVKRS